MPWPWHFPPFPFPFPEDEDEEDEEGEEDEEDLGLRLRPSKAASERAKRAMTPRMKITLEMIIATRKEQRTKKRGEVKRRV